MLGAVKNTVHISNVMQESTRLYLGSIRGSMQPAIPHCVAVQRSTITVHSSSYRRHIGKKKTGRRYRKALRTETCGIIIGESGRFLGAVRCN